MKMSRIVALLFFAVVITTHAQQPTAATKIEFVAVGEIKNAGAGSFTATLQAEHATNLVVFGQAGKTYLEYAQRRRLAWEKVAKRAKDFPTYAVTPDYAGSRSSTIQTIQPPPEPSFIVYGRKNDLGSFILIGKQEHVGAGGRVLSYGW